MGIDSNYSTLLLSVLVVDGSLKTRRKRLDSASNILVALQLQEIVASF